jgi:hypothetical protein
VESIPLTPDELAALDSLEDEQARGETVKWDEPKTVKGVAAREIETVTFTDRTCGEEKTSRILTLRTENGLQAIFDGPVALGWRLFGDDSPGGTANEPARRGDLLIVAYLGERTAESGREYKAFDVTRSAPEPDAQLAALIDGDPGPELEPNDPGVDEPEASDDDFPF